jgi:hypothetical protein
MEDLSPPAELVQDAVQTEFRGVGGLRPREPIGCVLEVVQKVPDKDGKWRVIRPFTGGGEGARWSFGIFGSSPSATMQRGSATVPIREPHPSFHAFNTAHPDLTAMVNCLIVHAREEGCLKYHRGAFQAPPGSKQPERGWWCRGDGQHAERWEGAGLKAISCLADKCQYSIDGSGPKGRDGVGQGVWCKKNMTFIAQFVWLRKDTPWPRLVFQLGSKSGANLDAAVGLFASVREQAANLGVPDVSFTGLPVTLTAGEHFQKRKGRHYPLVGFSLAAPVHEWLAGMHALRANIRQLALPEPKPLAELPPPGVSVETVERMTEAELSGYIPANER